MTITDRTTATKRVPMDSLRKTALVTGALYLVVKGFQPSPITAGMAATSDVTPAT